MSKQAPSGIKTTQHDFFQITQHGHCLFSVNPDMPVSNAMQRAGCILSAVKAILESQDEIMIDNRIIYGANCLVEMASAIVDVSADVISHTDAQQ